MKATICGKAVNVKVQLCSERRRTLQHVGRHTNRVSFTKETGYKIVNWQINGGQWDFALTYADMLRKLRGGAVSSETALVAVIAR